MLLSTEIHFDDFVALKKFATFSFALLNATQRKNQYYDIEFFTGSYALSADSKTGRFNFSGFTQ